MPASARVFYLKIGAYPLATGTRQVGLFCCSVTIIPAGQVFSAPPLRKYPTRIPRKLAKTRGKVVLCPMITELVLYIISAPNIGMNTGNQCGRTDGLY